MKIEKYYDKKIKSWIKFQEFCSHEVLYFLYNEESKDKLILCNKCQNKFKAKDIKFLFQQDNFEIDLKSFLDNNSYRSICTSCFIKEFGDPI